MSDIARSEGQLPPPIDATHRHLTEHIIDETLVPPGLPVVVSQVESVVAFDHPDIDTGVVFVTLEPGQTAHRVACFVEETLDGATAKIILEIAGGTDLSSQVDLPPTPGSGLTQNTTFDLLNSTIVRATDTPLELTVRLVSGTWTAGSIRLCTLIASAA